MAGMPGGTNVDTATASGGVFSTDIANRLGNITFNNNSGPLDKLLQPIPLAVLGSVALGVVFMFTRKKKRK